MKSHHLLRGTRDWCRHMADHTDTTPEDAELWPRLAEEIDDYLDPGPTEDGLF